MSLNDWTIMFLFVWLISQWSHFLILNILPVFLNNLYWKLRQCQVSYLQRQSWLSWLSCLILYSSIAALTISSIKNTCHRVCCGYAAMKFASHSSERLLGFHSLKWSVCDSKKDNTFFDATSWASLQKQYKDLKML